MSEFENLSFDDDVDEQTSTNIKSKTPAASKTPAGQKVTCYFTSTIGPSQKQEKLVVSNTASVGDIKFTIGQIFGLPPEEFHLSHNGRTMDPNDSIGNYDVEDGDTVLLIPVSTAGAV